MKSRLAVRHMQNGPSSLMRFNSNPPLLRLTFNICDINFKLEASYNNKDNNN